MIDIHLTGCTLHHVGGLKSTAVELVPSLLLISWMKESSTQIVFYIVNNTVELMDSSGFMCLLFTDHECAGRNLHDRISGVVNFL